MLKIAVFLVLCLDAGAAWSAEPLKIIGYPLATVALYDAGGTYQGDMPSAQLPAPEVAVEAFDEKRNLLAIEVAGKQVWLDPMDVKLNQGKGVVSTCRVASATSKTIDHKAGVTMGYSEDCGQ